MLVFEGQARWVGAWRDHCAAQFTTSSYLDVLRIPLLFRSLRVPYSIISLASLRKTLLLIRALNLVISSRRPCHSQPVFLAIVLTVMSSLKNNEVPPHTLANYTEKSLEEGTLDPPNVLGEGTHLQSTLHPLCRIPMILTAPSSTE